MLWMQLLGWNGSTQQPAKGQRSSQPASQPADKLPQLVCVQLVSSTIVGGQEGVFIKVSK